MKYDFRASYDNFSDVMYFSIGDPQPSFCDEQHEGFYIRYSLKSNRFCGVTVLNFKSYWISRINELIGILHLNVDIKEKNAREIL